MAKIVAIVMVLASFLLVAPVIESGTSTTKVFQAAGNAGEGGGGW